LRLSPARHKNIGPGIRLDAEKYNFKLFVYLFICANRFNLFAGSKIENEKMASKTPMDIDVYKTQGISQF